MKRFHIHRYRLALLLAIGLFAANARSNGATVNLDFSTPTISPNPLPPSFFDPFWFSLGPYVTTNQLPPNLELGFLNVSNFGGQSLDAKVRATPFGNATLIGILPNYQPNGGGQPQGDFGVLYRNNGLGSGGIHYDFEFFESGSGFATPATAPDVQLLLYDLDGESGFHTQTESVTARKSDGLSAYSLGTASNGLTPSVGSNEVQFDGNSSASTDGTSAAAVILDYQNTSKITLTFESEAISGSTSNPVFVAIDGDLSFESGFTGFDPAAQVPEPSTAILTVAAIAAIRLRRRKS